MSDAKNHGRGGVRDGGRGGRGGARGGRGGHGSRVISDRDIFGDGQTPPPDPKVTEKENAELQIKSKDLSLSGLKITDQMPLRPGYGTLGRRTTVWANYFVMVCSENTTFHRYSVHVQPEARGLKLKRIVTMLLSHTDLPVPQTDMVTDFRGIAYSKRRFPDCTLQIRYFNEYQDTPKDDAPSYAVSLRFEESFNLADWSRSLMSANQSAPAAQAGAAVHALNIFLGHYAKLNREIFTPVRGRSYPMPNRNPADAQRNQFDLNGHIEIIRGYFASVRPGTGRLLVNVNVSHGAFFRGEYLQLFLESFRQLHHIQYPAHVKRVERVINGLKIEAQHLTKLASGRSKVKIIIGLARVNDGRPVNGGNGPSILHLPRVKHDGAGPRDVSFWYTRDENSKGVYITVHDFFRQVHRINLTTNAPVVNVGRRSNPVYLPSELCKILPGQPYKHALTPDQTATVVTSAARPPLMNAAAITNETGKIVGLTSQANPAMQAFGIDVSPKLITVFGRVLDVPDIVYKDGTPGGRLTHISGGNADWNLASKSYLRPIDLGKWKVLRFVKRSSTSASGNARESTTVPLTDVVDAFTRGLSAVRISYGACERITVVYNDESDPRIEEAISKVPASPKDRFALMILPSKSNRLLYARLKLLCDVKFGVQSVCCTEANASRKISDPMFWGNLTLKVNAKLGGVNHALSLNAKLGVINDGTTMVVGLDVTHPSPGSSMDAPSVAGMVASVDKYLAQWPATLMLQRERKKETVDELGPMITRHLRIWFRKNNFLPHNIIVYRDGVSEGQYEQVVTEELRDIEKALKTPYEKNGGGLKKPAITVVIVGKRHQTRFYPTKAADAQGRQANCPNGTVVDRGITEARNWDFYLQAHASGQGTARPAHYYVVYDEIFGKSKLPQGCRNAADALQEMTHSMCYLYARATKAVSVCPPAYYADLVCERARKYLHTYYSGVDAMNDYERKEMGNQLKIHPSIIDSMFYL